MVTGFMIPIIIALVIAAGAVGWYLADRRRKNKGARRYVANSDYLFSLPSFKKRLTMRRIAGLVVAGLVALSALATAFLAGRPVDRYLVDDTGNRRWWTVAVRELDYSHGIDVQQLWAEVLALFQAGEQHWLTSDEFQALNEVNEAHEAVDPVEEMILSAFKWDAPKGLGWRDMTASDVLVAIGFDKPNKAQATHASKVLKKLTGGEPRRTNSGRFFSLPPLGARAANRMERVFGHNDETQPY